jgi:hypothetical protein
MSIPDQFLETAFLVKILKCFDSDADLGSGIFMTLDPGWKKKREGSGSGRPKNMRIRILNTV